MICVCFGNKPVSRGKKYGEFNFYQKSRHLFLLLVTARFMLIFSQEICFLPSPQCGGKEIYGRRE